VKVVVNGEPQELPAGTTVAELVAREPSAPSGGRGMAVAVDAEVVPRSQWDATRLSEGQQVEVLAAIQGG
jgi:sulfur carrier protein